MVQVQRRLLLQEQYLSSGVERRGDGRLVSFLDQVRIATNIGKTAGKH
jgi:hypothetical protein